MNDLLVKYNQLDEASKIAVFKFIDFLSANKSKSGFDMSEYKKKILDVSVWKDEDLEALEKIKGFVNSWKISEW